MARTPTRIGRYDVITALATGGMGRIFLARTGGMGGFERRVVVKTLEVPSSEDSDAHVSMFLDEARLLGLLHHQHICSVFEVGVDDGRHYMVLEYIDGYSAHDVFERAQSFGALLPLDFSLTIVAGAANGLHYTHTRKSVDGAPLGIVHRDVTPSNVMVGHDGAVKLIDFGIAMASHRKTKTQTGFVKGKVGYLSPEQVGGREVTARSDVFALGILLYEMTTLTRAFRDSSDLATMQRIKQGRYALPSQLVEDYPPDLEAIIVKALQVDPQRRWADADAMRRAVEAFGHRMRYVIGDAAVMEVMAQLYPPVASSGEPPVRNSTDAVLEWNTSEHDLTVRRDPAELLEALRESSRRDTDPPSRPPPPPPPPGGKRKLRAATEAADAFDAGDVLEPTMVRGGAGDVLEPTMVRGASSSDVFEPTTVMGAAAAPPSRPLAPPSRPSAPPPRSAPSPSAPPSQPPRVAAIPPPDLGFDSVPVAPAPRRSAERPVVGASLVAQRGRAVNLRWLAIGGGGLAVAAIAVFVVRGAASSKPVPAPTPAPVAARAPVVPAPAPPARVVEPPPKPSKVRIRITSKPTDATVILDGKRLGHTPLDETVPADPGKHTIKLRRRGYATQTLEVTLDADVMQDLTLTK